MRLLIAEDNPEISKALVTILNKNHYSVDPVFNGSDAVDYIMTGNYDGVLLDIMMPGLDGISVLKRIRAAGIQIPVLLLTAKSEIEDRVTGLDAGADDYLPKPFAMTELLARIRAMLRRKGEFKPDQIQLGQVSLNKGTYELTYTQHAIRLSNKEYQILEMLMSHPGQIISTEQLMERIWGWETDVASNTVWVTISNVRKKLLSIKAPIEIRALRGIGYSLDDCQ